MTDQTTTKAYPTSKNINLVLSGTGSLYPTQAGAVCALMDLGYSFKRIAATSGGALIGAGLSSGIDRDKLQRVIVNYNPWKILLRRPKLPFVNGWGFFDNAPLVEVLDRFYQKTTFQSASIPIEIIATQLTPSFGRFAFHAGNAPNLSLAEACRISSTIPILFRAAEYRGRTLIDGSFSDDLPIKTFEDEFNETIALNVQIKSVIRPNTFWEFMRFCTHMAINDQGFWKYTPKNLTMIPIEIYDYSTPLQFNLSRADRKRLFDIGYNAVTHYLNDIPI